MKILGMEIHMEFLFSKVKHTVQDLMHYTVVRANFRQRYKDGEALEYERLPGLTLSDSWRPLTSVSYEDPQSIFF